MEYLLLCGFVFTLPHAIEAKINLPFDVFHSSYYFLFAFTH